MWITNMVIGLLGVGINIWPLFIQECSSTLATYNLYTPYGAFIPKYWFAVTPQIHKNGGVSTTYYQVIPYVAALTPITTTTTTTTTTAPEQQSPRTMPSYGQSYSQHLRRPSINEYNEMFADEPSCAVWSWPDNVCDDDVNYPEKLIQRILEENLNEINNWPSRTTNSSVFIRDTDDNDHIDADHSGTCDSESRVIYPRVVKSVDDKWVYVANYKDFPQPVRIMKCSSLTGSCSPTARSQSTYGSKCEQSTQRLTMVAIDLKRRKPYKETFDMPVECRCVVFSNVFPTRSNRPDSHPPFPLMLPPLPQPPPMSSPPSSATLFPNHINVKEDVSNLGINHVHRHFEERVRRRH